MKRLVDRTVLGVFAICTFIVIQWQVVDALAAGRSLAAVRESGQLVIGVDIPYGVMEFYDDAGEPAGIDIDIAREIASAFGVKPQFSVMPFDDLFGALDEDRVDLVLSAVTITPERQKKLLFSAPYLSATTVLAVSKSNQAVNSFDDLAGARLGVLKGTLGEELARESELLEGMSLVAYTDNGQRIDALVNGEIDAAIVHFLVKTDLPVKIIGEPLRQNFYGVVANMKSDDLINEVDKVLRAMKRDGRIDAIKRRYIE